MGILGDKKAVERLSDRLAKLEDTCADLRRENRKLDLEFTELYDKVKRQMSRMAKRYAVDAAEARNDQPAADGSEIPDTVDPISRSILRRRGMMGGK